MTALVFWAALGLLAYTYAGYPLLVRLLARRRDLRPAGVATPSVSVVIAAFNEAPWIAAKLRSTFEPAYPAERLEVIVVSDGSTDATDTIVARWPDARVRLIRQEPNAGKVAALNRGVAAARGEVLVFTDANALFTPGALGRLVAPFADPRVGLVTGQGLYQAAAGEDARAVASGYVRYEAFVKEAEGRLGFIAGVDGAIYALRRRLYRELGPSDAHDLVHPVDTVLAGLRCRFEPEATTVEPPSRGGGQEFRRHVRIIAQGFSVFRRALPALLRAGRGWEAWCLLSHRFLRWTAGVPLGAALLANLALAGDGALYRLTLGAQLAAYGLAVAGWLAERAGRRLGRLAIPYYFCVVSAAGAVGIVRALRGTAPARWTPTDAGLSAASERVA
jgi:cellulose synthase/poly-beta-1,6-N-acetylglucosamine synthase-like glycosyltransferase